MSNLPSYNEAMKGRQSVSISEKVEVPQKRSKMSTLKSILTGDVQKHNPYFAMEEAVTGRANDFRAKKKGYPSKEPNTVIQIMTGEVYKHHPVNTIASQRDAQLMMLMNRR